MPYQKKPKTSYRSPSTEPKFPKKAHVIVDLAGCSLEEVHVILDPRKLRRREMNSQRHTVSKEKSTRKAHTAKTAGGATLMRMKCTCTKSTLSKRPCVDKNKAFKQ
jgi:hypothetical protein